MAAGAVCSSSFCPRSGRHDVRRPGLRCAGVVMTGRRLISIRFPPGGVNGHHPYRLFTRVITAGLFAPRRCGIGRIGRVSLGGLEQAEFAGPGDRGVAVLHAELAVQGALVGFHGVQ